MEHHNFREWMHCVPYFTEYAVKGAAYFDTWQWFNLSNCVTLCCLSASTRCVLLRLNPPGSTLISTWHEYRPIPVTLTTDQLKASVIGLIELHENTLHIVLRNTLSSIANTNQQLLLIFFANHSYIYAYLPSPFGVNFRALLIKFVIILRITSSSNIRIGSARWRSTAEGQCHDSSHNLQKEEQSRAINSLRFP